MVIEESSWTVLNESTAIKHADLSVFRNKGSVIPIKIRFFFEICQMKPGDGKLIDLIFNGSTYVGKLERTRSTSTVTRLMWRSDLSSAINKSHPEALRDGKYPDLKIVKINPKRYEISFSEELKTENGFADTLDSNLQQNHAATYPSPALPRLYPIICEEYKLHQPFYRSKLIMECLFRGKTYEELDHTVISRNDYENGVRSKTILNHYGINYRFMGLFQNLTPREALKIIPDSSEYDVLKSIISNNLDYIANEESHVLETKDEKTTETNEKQHSVCIKAVSTKDDTAPKPGVTFMDIEKMILGHLQQFYGKKCNSIEKILHIVINPNIKSYLSMISNGMLGNISRPPEEFKELNISMKSVNYNNGTVKESMSLPNFDYNELVSETWGASQTYQQFSSRFLFMIFTTPDDNSRNQAIFKKAFFWSMPKNDLSEVRRVWEKVKESIRNGDYENLPKKGENRVTHIRPHAANARDTIIGPDGRPHLKKSFWLNNTYIEELISTNL